MVPFLRSARKRAAVIGAMLGSFLLTTLSPCHAVAAEALPLVVVNKAYDTEKGVYSFDLLNQADQPITAWAIVRTFGEADGSEFTSEIASDYYISSGPDSLNAKVENDEHQTSGPLYPGQRHPCTWSLRNRDPLANPALHVFSIDVVAIIFFDTLSLGDEHELEQLFATRESNVSLFRGILEVLHEEAYNDTNGGSVEDRLVRLKASWKDRLAAIKAESRPVSPVHDLTSLFEEAIDEAIDGIRVHNKDETEVFMNLILLTTEYYEASELHSRQGALR